MTTLRPARPPEVQLALDAVTAVAACERERFGEFFAPDVRWHFPRSFLRFAADPPADSSDPVREGLDALAELAERARGMTFKRLEPLELVHAVTDSDSVACLMRVRAVLHNDERYENLYAWHMRLRDRKIVEVWELLDSAYAQSVFPWTRGH